MKDSVAVMRLNMSLKVLSAIRLPWFVLFITPSGHDRGDFAHNRKDRAGSSQDERGWKTTEDIWVKKEKKK